MNMAVTALQSDLPRERVIILVCAFAALAFGVFAALGAEQSVATILVACVFGVAALVLPLSWVALALAALIPLQIYFPFAGGLNLRGALVFAAVAALRVLVLQLARYGWQSVVGRLRSLPWVIPAALFLFAALAAAVAAPNRQSALKGIYDWLLIFATAFVVGEIVHSKQLVKSIVVILIVGGVSEALLGLAQAKLDVPRVISVLQSPISALVYQPNLLRDRLSDLSFNWISNERVLSFGTFINNIDYAIFLAAILTLVLALLLGEEQPMTPRDTRYAIRHTLALFICAALLGVALLQTSKGSGMLALAGGVGAIALLYAPRLSPRLLTLGAIISIVALVLAAPFYDELAQRVVFLIQRETGALFATGRTVIWAQVLAYLPQRPWFGWGLNNSGLLVAPLPSLNGGAFVFNIPTAESAYVAALVETGIVGFAALMLFIVVVLARAYRVVQATRASACAVGISAAMVALFCGSLTVVSLTTDQNGMLLGVLIGTIFGMRTSVEKKGE
jgi:O-antigen ligase